MIVSLNKKILFDIFSYFKTEAGHIKDIKLFGENNKIICFDTMIYKEPNVEIIIDGHKELKILYNGDELKIEKVVIIYRNEEREKIDVAVFKQYFVEEVINYIAYCNNFDWSYK